MKPLSHPACPLCGQPNECAVARTGRFDVACWCTGATVDPRSLAMLGDAERGRACLCPRCAAAPPPRRTQPLFAAGAFRAHPVLAGELPALQAFFDANPAYFLEVTGEPPRADEARQEFDDMPPAGMPFRGRWLLSFADGEGRSVGMASLLSDFLADGVWHIGLFIVATALHGRGVAAALYRGLEQWMAADGAQWIRLGVVVGNAKAERFWQKMGYREVRRRTGLVMGRRTNDVAVRVKPLGAGSIGDYLQRVERDRPDSTLP